MEELSIEQKAKAYDGAIEVIKKCDTDKYGCVIGIKPSDIFPSLKESEDEKIRKALIEFVQGMYMDCRTEEARKERDMYLDWLEKQGEKPNTVYDKELSEILGCVIRRYINVPNISYTEREKVSREIIPYVERLEKQGEHANFFNKIQIGDKVTRNEDGVLVNLSQLNRVAKKQCEKKSTKFDDTNAKRMFIKALERVEEQNAKGYKLTDCDKNSWWEDFKAFCSEQILANSAKTCKDEQDAAWSEKYIADVFEKVGLAKIVREQSNDALTNAIQDAMIELSKFLPQQNSTWSEEDEKQARQIERIVHDDGCTQKLQKQIADWFKSIKDRVQPKQEWSEEDETCAGLILRELEQDKKDSPDYSSHFVRLIDWFTIRFKSLRPQNRWKPCEQDILLLEGIANGKSNPQNFQASLGALIGQLKKLREE